MNTRSAGVAFIIALAVFGIIFWLAGGVISMGLRIFLPLFTDFPRSITEGQQSFLAIFVPAIRVVIALLPAFIAFRVVRAPSVTNAETTPKRTWVRILSYLWAILVIPSIGLAFLEFLAIGFAAPDRLSLYQTVSIISIFILPIILAVGSYAGFKLAKSESPSAWLLFLLPIALILFVLQAFASLE